MKIFNNNNNTKEQSSLKIKWIFLIILCSLFLLSIFYFFYYIFAPTDRGNVTELTDSWSYYSKSDPDFHFDSRYVTHLPKIDRNETFVMETTLKEQVNDSNLLIKGNHQWIRVYLDKQLLYDRSHILEENNPGLSLAVIDLPTDYAGKILKIEVASPYRNYAGFPPKVYIGTTGPMISFIFSRSIPQVVTMIIAVFLAIGTLSYSTFILYKKRKLDVSLLILSCFALVLGFQSVSEDILSGVLFEPIVHSILSHVFIILTSILIISYYLTRMIYYKKIYGLFCIVQISIQLGVLVYSLMTPNELPELMPIVNVVSVISTLVTSLASIGEAYKNNRFFVACTPWIVLIAIFHCMIYIQSALGIYQADINWSTILFVLILIVIVVYNIIEYIVSFDQYQRAVGFLEVKSDLLEQHYDQLREHIQEISSLRHEFIQNMENIEDLILENKSLEAQNEIRGILNEAQNFKFIFSYSVHQLTNLILARYQDIASKRNIQVEFKADLPEKPAVSDNDLTQLLIHVLEHSFRETHAIEDPMQRKISLHLKEKEDELLIHCEHSAHYETNLFSHGITEELQEKEQFDLTMIKDIAERYAGTLRQEKDNKSDRLTIQLKHPFKNPRK